MLGIPYSYTSSNFKLQVSSANHEATATNGNILGATSNPSACGGVPIPANEQVLAIKRTDLNSKLPNSNTLDSLNELQVNKTGTPSMISRFFSFLIKSKYLPKNIRFGLQM